MTPINFKGIYEFAFSGIKFGKFGIEAEQNANHYTMTADIVSTGLVGAFVKHSSHTIVDTTGSNFTYPDRHYETHYQTKNKKKSAMMVYKDSELTQEAVTPPENPQKRPPVSMELKKQAVDPLSLLLIMRQKLYEAEKNHKDSFSINVYDGRRLTQANFIIRGKKKMLYNDRQVPVIVADVSRKLIAGFTASEIAERNPNEPGVRMYISDDDRMLPLRLEVATWMGTLSATLAKECRTGESCLFGIKE